MLNRLYRILAKAPEYDKVSAVLYLTGGKRDPPVVFSSGILLESYRKGWPLFVKLTGKNRLLDSFAGKVLAAISHACYFLSDGFSSAREKYTRPVCAR